MAKQIGSFIITAALIYASTFIPGLGFTLAMAKLAIVAAAISTVVGYVFRPKLGDFGLFDRTRMVRQAITSRRIVYGYQKVSGPIVFITSTNNDKYLHMVIALADHEIQEIESFYLNDLRVFTDANGFVTASEYNRGNSLVRIKAKLGTDNQTAESTLVSEVAEWTNDHRLRGIAYLYVRLEFNDKVFQQGIPNISAVIRGKKVLDYRTSTTAYSYNPAMILADYLTSDRHGLGCDVSEIDTASFIAAANVCDENVLLAEAPSAISQGTYNISGSWYEDRYQCHGVIDTEKTPAENIEQLLTSMGGTLAYVGGKWTVKAAAYYSPAMTLTIDDLRGPIGMQTKVPRNEVFNAVKGIFINPDASWQPTDYAAITSATFEAEDGNRQIFVDLNLPFTISHSMAQRLAKIGLYRSRQEITLSMPCKLKAFDLKPGDTVNVTIDRYGFSSKVFEVVDWKLAISNDEVGVDLQLRELASSVFSWNAEESAFSEDNTTLPNSYDQPDALTNVTFGSTARVNEDGTIITVSTISWTQSPNIFVQSGGYIEAEYKKTADTNWTAMQSVSGDAVQIVIEDLEPNEYYDFRVRTVNINGVTSDYSTLTNQLVTGDVTAPGIATSLVATGSYKTVQLTWTNPTDKDWFQTQIWRNTSNNSATATLIGSVSASTYADSGLADSTTYYYWLKTKDFTGNTSAFSTGANATTIASASGDAGRTVSISGTRGAFVYDTNNANPTPANDTVTATAFNTSGTVYYEFLVEGSSVQNTTSNTYTYTPQASYLNMPDQVSVKIREGSSSGTVVAQDSMTYVGVKAGSNAVQVWVANPAHTLYTTNAGVVTYTGSGTTIQVAEGTSLLTEDSSSPYANSTFRVTASGTNITPSSPTGQGTTTLTFPAHSNMTQNNAYITYTVIAKNSAGVESTITVYQNFAKSIQGNTGPQGDQGIQGVQGPQGDPGTNGLNGLTFINAYRIQSQSDATPTFTTPTSGSALPSGWSSTVGSPTVGQVVWYIQGRYNSSSSTIDGVAANTTAWTGPVAASIFQDIRSDNWNGSSPPTAATVSSWGTDGYYISRGDGNMYANGFYARGKVRIEGNNNDALGTALKVNENANAVFGVYGYGNQYLGRGVSGVSSGTDGVGVVGTATASGARAGVLALRTSGTGAALEVSGGTIKTDSSTVVTNLNADKVDGYDGTDFVRIAAGTTNDKYVYYVNNTETPSDPVNRAAWIKISTNDGGIVFFPGYV